LTDFLSTRYALDFRLMTEQRITILDASYSIFADPSTSKPRPSSNGSNSSGNGNNNKSSGSGSSSSSSLDSSSHLVDGSVMLQPIPDFKKVVAEIASGESGNGVFSIDVGLICGVDAVKRVGKALHDRLVI
jgi:hypothetical protein